jgi:hypothetical protein
MRRGFRRAVVLNSIIKVHPQGWICSRCWSNSRLLTGFSARFGMTSLSKGSSPQRLKPESFGRFEAPFGFAQGRLLKPCPSRSRWNSSVAWRHWQRHLHG